MFVEMRNKFKEKEILSLSYYPRWKVWKFVFVYQSVLSYQLSGLSSESTLRLGGHGFDPLLERQKKVPIASLLGTNYLSLTRWG